MWCVEVSQVQYIVFKSDSSCLKAVAIVTSEHLKLSTNFAVSQRLGAH